MDFYRFKDGEKENLSFWEWWPKHSGMGLGNFRAQNNFLGDREPHTENAIFQYVKSIGRLDWLNICQEDGAFGVKTQNCENYKVSRDLVDSVIEIDWLNKTLPADQWNTILDIGAGYGRLAHRLHQLFPEKKVYCTDMVDISLQACKTYLEYRKVPSPIFHAKDLPNDVQFDLAMNIHSFPECKREEIIWWLDWVANHNVKYLFIIPHMIEDTNREMLCLYDMKSFKPDILERGYQVEANWWGPDCWKRDFYLFKKNS